MEQLVLSMTDERDTVFDPYMGVGTSVVAALMRKRNGYVCDNVSSYVEVASERITALKNSTIRTRSMIRSIYEPNLRNGGQ